MLRHLGQWNADGHRFVRWSVPSRKVLQAAKRSLQNHLRPVLSRACMHIKGHGGAKRMVRILDTCSTSYPWVARFDIASYYESMRHDILLSMLNEHKVDDELRETVDEYLRLPDHENRGVGMVAGGAISPLLGALYLDPLDKAMQRLEIRGKIIYRRFMDDFVILAACRN